MRGIEDYKYKDALITLNEMVKINLLNIFK
jgi:hypothetical protein